MDATYFYIPCSCLYLRPEFLLSRLTDRLFVTSFLDSTIHFPPPLFPLIYLLYSRLHDSLRCHSMDRLKNSFTKPMEIALRS